MPAEPAAIPAPPAIELVAELSSLIWHCSRASAAFLRLGVTGSAARHPVPVWGTAACMPRRTPGGNSFMFLHRGDVASRMLVADADGSNPRFITPRESLSSPSATRPLFPEPIGSCQRLVLNPDPMVGESTPSILNI